MQDVVVRVFKDGRLLETVIRPLRKTPDGSDAVTYRRQLHLLDNANRLFLDDTPPRSEDDLSEPLLVCEPASVAAPATIPFSQTFENFRRAPGREDFPTRWNQEQEEVIEAPSDARLLVSAPPGTGKTATACMRVARLAAKVGGAHKVWVVSFTRVATGEFRTRVLGFPQKQQAANLAGIRIQTLDSLAWTILSGFEDNATLDGFDETIRRANLLLQTSTQCAEDLSEVSHLIIDEAQDIIGVRAQLLHSLIAALPPTAGVTVFGDEAQAIYGFSLDDHHRENAENLIDTIRQDESLSFREITLKEVYRAGSDRLAHLVSAGRFLSLSPDIPQGQRSAQVNEVIRNGSDGTSFGPNSDAPADAVFLYRRRFDVLNALAGKNPITARVRLTSFPVQLATWIAICLHDFVRDRLTEPTFANLWGERINQSLHPTVSLQQAWSSLLAIGGSGRAVDMAQVREGLLRGHLSPALAREVLGSHGPLLSTIHAFKGREAREVHLALPSRPLVTSSPAQDDEEARVLYVGATRATDRLLTHSPQSLRCHYLSNGRAWRSYRHTSDTIGVAIEVGRVEDIDYESVCGTRFHRDETQAHSLQSLLGEVGVQGMRALVGRYDFEKRSYALSFGEDDGIVMAHLSTAISSLLYDIGKQLGNGGAKFQPRGLLKPIYMVGARTHVLADESPLKDKLHEPWRTSGMFLVPTLIGLPWITLKRAARNGHS